MVTGVLYYLQLSMNLRKLMYILMRWMLNVEHTNQGFSCWGGGEILGPPLYVHTNAMDVEC